MKLGLEVYDDPNLAGTQIMPAQFATDAQGDLASYAGSPYTLTGTGRWLKLAFWIPGVDLVGVGTAPLTGGPTLSFANGGNPYIDRIELGIFRAGTNAMAGQDPLPDYFMNPLICTTNYGYFAEWDPHSGITNNVTVGSSGGDQQMVVQMAGPPDDQRLAEAPAPGSGNPYIQFALLNNVFGPNLQDNANVAIQLTYYDDPNLVGASIGLNAYYSYVNGIAAIIGPPAPYNARAVLKGTGQWVDAYFYLPNVSFIGVNQGPQSVARMTTSRAVSTNLDSGVIFVSRIRYDVIRPCGPFQGIDMLQFIGIQQTNLVPKVSWFGTAALQAAIAANGPYTNILSVTNFMTNTYTPPVIKPSQFFRLQYPPYPFF